MWLLIAVFFAVLIGMVFNAWRKQHEALGMKLRGLKRLDAFPFDADKEKSRARATYKGKVLEKALEEIDLKATTESLKAERCDRLTEARQNAMNLMVSINILLLAGLVYTLYRFLTT